MVPLPPACTFDMWHKTGDTSPADGLRQWSMTLADVTFFAFCDSIRGVDK